MRLAIGLGLIGTFFAGPLLGFWCGTVFGSNHIVDLQVADINNGLVGAVIGGVLGFVGLMLILAIYPSKLAQDDLDWEEEFSSPHFSADSHH